MGFSAPGGLASLARKPLASVSASARDQRAVPSGGQLPPARVQAGLSEQAVGLGR